MNKYFSWFNGLVHATSFLDLIVEIGTTGIYFSYYDMFPLNDQFNHNWYMLMLI